MRPDDINPRTGLVVAVVSVFLVFGFMFTVSGIKGEFLGDIPLLAIGPAICLPGVAAIILAKRTDGCTKWPENTCACVKKLKMDKEVVELLKTPCSDLESGKGSSDELDKKSGPQEPFLPRKVGSSPKDQASVLEHEDEVLQYLEECYCPESPPPAEGDAATAYCVFQKINSTSSRILYTAAEDKMVFRAHPIAESPETPGESIPEDKYSCYINPQEVTWDRETIV
ncbi:hypothetical protein NDU88_005897 [Pleurodeles waltl]|uniref:Transmembrane protein 215 n=1 Tax=Pleurodeles waltl TaxID=8319 RepID=A0AAV7WW10_PLEWA|nr:hypothetical protein NDU88_005897 [Pleurodeles waltl]